MSAGAIAARLLPWRHANDWLAGILRCQIAVTGSVTDSLRDTNPLLVTGLNGWLSRPGANGRHSDQKGLNMITNEVSDGLAGILRTAIVELVRRDGPDLSARQLGVFLTCYLDSEAQTVRGLAAKLSVSKPAITRALDRLSEFDLVRRKTDPLDRRSVLVQRTATGMAFMRELRTILRDAASTMRITAEPASTGRQRAGSEARAATH
jgi:DNA-binding MarR family transcriptional regulator